MMDEEDDEQLRVHRLVVEMGKLLENCSANTGLAAIVHLLTLYFIFNSRPRMSMDQAMVFLDAIIDSIREYVQLNYDTLPDIPDENGETAPVTWDQAFANWKVKT